MAIPIFVIAVAAFSVAGAGRVDVSCAAEGNQSSGLERLEKEISQSMCTCHSIAGNGCLGWSCAGNHECCNTAPGTTNPTYRYDYFCQENCLRGKCAMGYTKYESKHFYDVTDQQFIKVGRYVVSQVPSAYYTVTSTMQEAGFHRPSGGRPESGILFEWVGFQVKFAFRGDALYVRMKAPECKNMRFHVLITTGEEKVEKKLRMWLEHYPDIAIAERLGEGPHQVVMTKVTECYSSTYTVSGPVFLQGFLIAGRADQNVQLLDPPGTPTSFIDYFGDSDTVAFGVDEYKCENLFSLPQRLEENTDHLKGWAQLTARRLGRAARVQAISGYGCLYNAQGLDGEPLPSKMLRVLPFKPQGGMVHVVSGDTPINNVVLKVGSDTGGNETTAPDGYKVDRTDLVVILLGPNDWFSLPGSSVVSATRDKTTADYTDAMQSMLLNLYKYYCPGHACDTKFAVVYGGSGLQQPYADYKAVAERAVLLAKEAESGLHAFAIGIGEGVLKEIGGPGGAGTPLSEHPETLQGCAYHFNGAGHSMVADSLTPQFRSILGEGVPWPFLRFL